MAILFHWEGATLDIWLDAFRAHDLGSDIRLVNSLGDIETIDHAVVWDPPPGLLRNLPNLKYIFSIGAGVNHITDDPQAPVNVPIVRLQDSMLVLDISCHIIYMVLHFHRHYWRYKNYEQQKKWLRHKYPANEDRRVAVLGLGQTGLNACKRLRELEFDVIGWSNSAKTIEGIRCLHGPEAFAEVLAQADILVNLLPLTPLTQGLLNDTAFASMPDQSFLINCGRGGTVVDEHLLAALDRGRIEAAALDVFPSEPLAPTSPYWDHPAVTVTPHAAAPSNEKSAADFIAGNIRKSLDGEKPSPVVDFSKGY